jgi:hypothetical protein
MVRHSKKSKRGGEKFNDIKETLRILEGQINDLKDMSEPMMAEPMMSEPMMAEPMMEEVVKVDKTWVDDKNKKFRDGAGGRVTLSFNRITSLLDNNIKKGDTKKEWSEIKRKLMDANSTDEVQNVIDEYKVSFSSNYVAGTRKKRRHGRKRTHRRY